MFDVNQDDFIKNQKEMYIVVKHCTEMGHWGNDPEECEYNVNACFRKEDADLWIKEHEKYLNGSDWYDIETIPTFFPGLVGE